MRGWIVHFQKCRKSTREASGAFVLATAHGYDKEARYTIERAWAKNSGESNRKRFISPTNNTK